MFRKGQYSTETDRGPFIFTLAALTVGAAVTVLLFTLASSEPLAVFAGIMFAVVTAAAAAVMFALVTDRAYIEDDVLHMSYLFRRSSVPVKDIGWIKLQDDVYHIYDRNDRQAGTINAKLTSIGEVILALDKNGVEFR